MYLGVYVYVQWIYVPVGIIMSVGKSMCPWGTYLWDSA